MKCDGLNAYKADVTIPVYGTIADADVYLKKDVDAAIAELKEAWRSEHKACEALKAELDKAIAERDGNQVCIDALKAKLEDVQASAYAESVDAGMENRKLKRALWLARAERASDKARIFYFNDLEIMLDIDGFSYDSKKKKGHKKLTARIWRIIWLKVERKCLEKAEEYK